MGGVTVGWVFNLHDEVPSSAPKLIAIAIVFPCLALLSVVLRLGIRLRAKSAVGIGVDDIAASIAWVRTQWPDHMQQ